MKNFLTDIVGVSPVTQADAALDKAQGKSKFVATSLVPADDAPTFDDDGYTAMRPSFDEADMLAAFEDPAYDDSEAKLEPQEAYDAMKFQAPLSDGERSILNETPFLGPDLTFVDDADHNEWVLQRVQEKGQAMDNVLEDQMYGEEPGVDAAGDETQQFGELLGDSDELGWGLSSITHAVSRAAKGVAHGVARGASAVEHGVSAGFKDIGHLSKMVVTWPAKKLEAVAKMVASAAATPIKKAARPLVNTSIAAIARKNGHAVPTAADKKAGAGLAIGIMKRNGNPLVKFGGLVLNYVGTGVSGEPIAVLGHDGKGNKVYGRRDIDLLSGGRVTTMGFTGIEIAALAAGSALAINLVMSKLKGSAAAAAGPPAAAPIDPSTGQPMSIDPSTGQPVAVDPSTGMPMDPTVATQYAAQQQPQQPPQAYDPNAGMPAYDPNSPMPPYDPNSPNAGMPAYDPSTDPNAYSSGDDMSKDEGLDTLIFGDEGDDTLIFGDEGDDTLVYGGEEPGVTAQGTDVDVVDTLVYGEDPAYDLMVGKSGTKMRGPAISAERYKALCVKRAQTTSGNEAPDVKHLRAAHAVLGKKLTKKGIRVKAPKGTPPGTSSGAWLYKLDPLYWLKSSQERGFIDAEKANYERTKDLKKEMGKKASVLDAGRRAVYQAEQAQAAKAQADAVNVELKDIQESISSGAFVGSDGKAASKTVAIIGAAAAQGQKDAQRTSQQCDALIAKLQGGQSLTTEEIGKLRGCLKMCGHLKKLHDQLHAKASSMGYRDEKNITSPFLGAHRSSSREMTDVLGAHRSSSREMTDVLGENVQEILGGENVQEILGAAFVGKNSGANDILGAAGPTQAQFIALTAVAATQPGKLPAYMKQQGIKLTKQDLAKLKVATNRAKIIMSHPEYGKMKINKTALSAISGGDDSMGSIFGTFGKILTAPLAATALAASALSWGVNNVVLAPAHLLGKVTNWGAKKGGWGTIPGYGGGARPAPAPGMPGAPPAVISPLTAAPYPMAQLPPGMPPPPPPAAGLSPQMQAAYQQRQIAAYQRQAAAQAQSDTSNQQLNAAAAAADAEAAALEAEGQAQQDQQAAMQASYGISPGDGDDSMGEDEILGADFFSGYTIEPIPGKEKEVEKAKAITAEAQKNTTTGKKIRAGATLYHKAKKGHAPSRLAIQKMEQKAKAGDPQAKRDVNAVKAGKIAIHAKGHAKKVIARKSLAEARKKRFAANQKKVEAKLGNRLAEHSRRKRLVKISKVEYRAAHGDKKAKLAIAHHVARAKAGDKKAQANVAALKLARHVRTSAKTPQDLRRQRQAGKLIAKARHGHKKAIRQVALIQHAAKAGQPNAKRAMKHLTVAAHVERTVATGKVSLPDSKTDKQKQVVSQRANDVARYKMLKARVAGPMGTREEALAAAKLGQKLGLKEEAAALALRARKLRSAAQPIKDTAAVVAAAENGNQEAQTVMADSLASASRGEPKGIASAGKIAGVQALAAVSKGQPMPKPIAEATQIVERAQAGDPEAKRVVARAGEASQNPSHPNHAQAVELAVALTAASGILAATAAKKGAHDHWKEQARKSLGQHVEPGEKGQLKEELDAKVTKLRAGEGTYADGLRARELAMALGMTGLAAQISAIMPPADTSNPMSSLPESPLPPITGWKSFLVEAAKAITLSTPNPFENYREGVTSRNSTPMLRALGPTMKASTAGDDDSVREFADGAKKPELAMTERERAIAAILKRMAAGDKDATGSVVAVRMAALGGNHKAKAEYQLMLKVAKETGFDLEGRMS